jgi:hypothetical protein
VPWLCVAQPPRIDAAPSASEIDLIMEVLPGPTGPIQSITADYTLVQRS